MPAALGGGTRVEVRDLFYATPARLKFLKTARTEIDHAADAINRLAMAHPGIAFRLTVEGRDIVSLAAAQDDLLAGRLDRLSAVMGRSFADNALAVDAEREGAHLSGYIGVPTFNRPSARAQYLFVNGRPVRDRLLGGAVRGAYADFLARNRHPAVALFLEVPADAVDVNVHPAKAEVRFRDGGIVRGLIVGALRHALAGAGHRASTTVSDAALGAFRPQQDPGLTAHGGGGTVHYRQPTMHPPAGLAEAAAAYFAPSARADETANTDAACAYPLGAGRVQFNAT